MSYNERFNNLHQRAKIINTIRDFFHIRGFLEVETPMMIPTNAPEEYIDPFAAGSWYLQTSPELCMKRLLARGHDKLFQISRCWRHGERGRRHLPEFTMLEWYRSKCNYNDLMDDCEQLLKHLAKIQQPGVSVDSSSPCHKMTVHHAFECFTDISVATALTNDLFDEYMSELIEPALPQTPIFIYDYPIEKAALAQSKPDNPSIAERFELYVGGLELANGFSELINQAEQRNRFVAANNFRENNGNTALPLPEAFLSDLSKMPPAAGIALGIDRLVMLMTGSELIDTVVAFTPEEL